MISIYHKVNGHFEMTNNLSDLKSLNREDIIWVDLLAASDDDEVFIENHLGLEIMNKQESLEIEQSARFVEYSDHTVSHIDFVTRQGINFIAKIVSFTVEKNLLITNRDYAFRTFTETSKKVLAANSKFGSSEVFSNIIDSRIANDADLVEDLTKEISELSKVIITQKHTSKDVILKLSALRENLMLMMRNCLDKKFLISINKKTKYLNENTEHELDISVKDLESVIDFIRFNFDRLDYIDSTLNNLITYEQNNSIKLFTIVSVYFMPPMLIASVYGMNFDYIPELKWLFGYPFALVLMVLTVIGTSIYFKRKRWI